MAILRLLKIYLGRLSKETRIVKVLILIKKYLGVILRLKRYVRCAISMEHNYIKVVLLVTKIPKAWY